MPSGDPVADLAALSAALADPSRLAVLALLTAGPRNVEQVADQLGLSTAEAATHLDHLRDAGLLVRRGNGERMLYGLGPAVVVGPDGVEIAAGAVTVRISCAPPPPPPAPPAPPHNPGVPQD